MNEQRAPGGIGWTRPWGRPGYTANPIRGCLHGCEWRMPDGTIARCYAGDLARGLAKAAYPHGFEHLSFHPEELGEISKRKTPSGIFIDSMSDMYGQKVPAGWISEVATTIHENPQHEIFSLTKNFFRLKEFSPMPANQWVGISSPPTFMFGKELSLDRQRTWFKKAMENLMNCECHIRWVSFEPLSIELSDIICSFPPLDWAVIGAASNGPRTFQPDREALAKMLAVLKCPIYFKENLDRKLAFEVAGSWRQEFPSESLIRQP